MKIFTDSPNIAIEPYTFRPSRLAGNDNGSRQALSGMAEAESLELDEFPGGLITLY